MRFLISRGYSMKNSKLGIPNMKKYTLIYMYTPNFCHLSIWQKMDHFCEYFASSLGSFFDVNSKFHACWHPRKSLLIRVSMTNLHFESVYPSRESTNSIFTFVKLKIDTDQIIPQCVLLVELIFDYDVIIKFNKFLTVTWLDNLSDVKFW